VIEYSYCSGVGEFVCAVGNFLNFNTCCTFFMEIQAGWLHVLVSKVLDGFQ
jgi:hypothetical protein